MEASLQAPLLPSIVILSCISAAAFLVLFYYAQLLFKAIRVYVRLRNVPRPKQHFRCSFFLDVWHKAISMDPSLEMPARIFLCLKSMFHDIIDQDLTLSFHGPMPILIAVTPSVAEKVLSGSENVNKSFLYAMMKSWIGNGLLTSDKVIWRKRRKALTPAFHFRILDEYVPVMNRRAVMLTDKLAHLGKEHFDILPVIRLTAFAILFETAMGVKLGEEEAENSEFLKVNDEMAASIMTRMITMHHWSDFIYKRTQKGREFYEKVELIKKYTQDVLRSRKKAYKIEEPQHGAKKQSFMDILLRMHMEEGVFTLDEIREEVNTFMIGGFDTTAMAASYAIHLLGNHPEVQAKVHEELDAVFRSDEERPVTAEDIKQLKYLGCVIKEALRLYPPIPLIAREVGEDLSFGDVTIPKGAVSIVFIYFMHRHPRFFAQPDAFVPERFLEEERHPFLYIPFASGARNCIGQKFAQLEDKILLAHILRRFTVHSMIPNEDLQMSLELVLRPTQGLHVKFTPRDRTAA